jgi:hypothetical protein
MFLCKRERQDIQPGIAYLATRVQNLDECDWRKLIKIIDFLKETIDVIPSMTIDDKKSIKWYVDAALAVHKDFKSHTSAVMSMGNGIISSVSTKQKVSSRSSTEAEFIAVDDVVSKVLWTKLFLEKQGYKIEVNVIYRDNESSMKIERNGKSSSGKRTWLTDLIRRNMVEIRYCPTSEMIADYMTKPLSGSKFLCFWRQVLGIIPIEGQQECIGKHKKRI